MTNTNIDISRIHGLRILVIEDDTVSRIFLRELLTLSQAQIDYARSGYEANQHFAKGNVPDVVLLDLRLPDADGVELATTILKDHPNLPIIAQTAYVSVGMEERCMNAGIKAFIAKPIKKAQLLELLLQFA
ncbi:MAG: response regulator [Bacteroidales bacterium]